MKLTDRRGVPEAGQAPRRLSFKNAEHSAGQMLALDDAEGIVTAIVSVTGTVDEVNDIIVPGAYAETLVKRRPKVCWAHSWEHPIGRVLHIEELHPGDERLPREDKDGKPWDPKAGALVATMQFNMRTDEGKNAFEAVRFYSETGECEYSIGYNVPPGKSTRDGMGTRHIKALDLYELSVVLFGAHSMTGTISVKASIMAALERKTAGGTVTAGEDPDEILLNLLGMKAKVEDAGDAKPKPKKPDDEDEPEKPEGKTAKAALAAIQSKAAPKKGVNPFVKKDEDDDPEPAATDGKPAAAPEPVKEPEKPEPEAGGDKPETTLPDFTDGVMIAVYPDPGAADQIAQAIAGPDETVPREDLHVTLAYLGKDSEVGASSDEIVKKVTDALAGEAALTGTVGGIGTFPPSEDSDNGVPTWVPVDVPGLTLLRETIAAALGDLVNDEHGFTPHMTIGWDLGLIDPIPEIPVEFTSVRVVYGTQAREVSLDASPVEEKSMTSPRLLYLSVDEVAALTALDVRAHPEVKAEGGADRNAGGAEDLRRYWTTGAGGAKIAWGTPGDFTRCVRLLSEHMLPERAKGYCANRHKEMTGMWPGDKDNKGYDPALETKGPSPALPYGKGYPRLPGSIEEQQDNIVAAVVEALRGELLDEADGRWEWPGVCVDATFPDGRLIATRHKYDGSDTQETFQMDYEINADGSVDLGAPDRVELEVVAVNVEDTDDAYLGDSLPLAEGVYEIAHAFTKAHGASMEAKAGRVLSGTNERQLRAAVERLVDVLNAAGLNIRLAEGDDEESPGDPIRPARRSDSPAVIPAEVDLSTTSRTASGKALRQKDGVFLLDRKDLEADLAAYLD